ncbi:MAG TPA: outer membrane beta-barrel protein, partial [Flavobacterium sp.]|nr:outer membrane beta-barrel protein [Flavobacterium sp.]
KKKIMKKIILSTVAFLAFGYANAQEAVVTETDAVTYGLTEGDWWAEGYFKYSSTSDETSSVESTFSFTPQIGYMLNSKWGVGGYLSFGGQSYNEVNGRNLDSSGSWGIGAFARHYFLSLGKHKSFQAYGEIGLGYSALTTDYNNGIDSTTDSALNARVNVGLNYFFTPKFAATFVLANILSYNSNNNDTAEDTNDLTVNINLYENIFATPQFGLLYKW